MPLGKVACISRRALGQEAALQNSSCILICSILKGLYSGHCVLQLLKQLLWLW